MRLFGPAGNITGRVVAPNGAPVGAGVIVKAYYAPDPSGAISPRTTLTDANGRYDFNPPPRPNDWLGDLYRHNNWALNVLNGGDQPGRADYAVVAGSSERPFGSPGQRIARIESSKRLEINLISDPDPESCPVPPLDAITDPDAIIFEANNGNVFAYVDSNGTVRMDPSMLETPTSAGRILCLKNVTETRGGTWMPESAWRPQAFQNHLRNILETRRLLRLHRGNPACAALRAEVERERAMHRLRNRVARVSTHTCALPSGLQPCTGGGAIDIGTAGISGMPAQYFADVENICGLKRLTDYLPDPGHFSITGH